MTSLVETFAQIEGLYMDIDFKCKVGHVGKILSDVIVAWVKGLVTS